MPTINELIAQGGGFPDIGNAFSRGQEEGRIRNALAFAAQNYATNPQAAANALMGIVDIRGAKSIMENVQQTARQKVMDARQASLDELNRRNIESEIAARESRARDPLVEFLQGQEPQGMSTGNIPAAPHPFQR